MKNRSKEKSHKNVKKYKHIKYKIYIFGIYMAVMAIISTLYCMIPVRRAENQEQFPAFTIESFMNGEYFRYIELWYNNRFLLDYRVFEEKGQVIYQKILFGKNTYELNGYQMIILPTVNERKEKMLTAMEEAKRFSTETKMIALTFDDGPSQYTNRLLDILTLHGAKATFYLVGSRIDYFPDTIKKMDNLKMEFGNHTYDHKYLSEINGKEEYLQLKMVDEKLMHLINKKTSTIRPPGGKTDVVPSVFIDKPFVMWSVDPMDWSVKNKNLIAENILNEVTDGSVILLHDLYEYTIDAMEIVIPKLKAQGYELVTVSKLAQTKGYNLEAKVIYSEFPFHNSN